MLVRLKCICGHVGLISRRQFGELSRAVRWRPGADRAEAESQVFATMGKVANHGRKRRSGCDLGNLRALGVPDHSRRLPTNFPAA